MHYLYCFVIIDIHCTKINNQAAQDWWRRRCVHFAETQRTHAILVLGDHDADDEVSYQWKDDDGNVLQSQTRLHMAL